MMTATNGSPIRALMNRVSDAILNGKYLKTRAGGISVLYSWNTRTFGASTGYKMTEFIFIAQDISKAVLKKAPFCLGWYN